VDGDGTLLTTEECLLHPNRNPHLSKNDIENVLCQELGCTKVIWLPLGLANDDDTNGHVDNFCCFVRPGEVVLAWTDDDDEDGDNYRRCRLAEEVLMNEVDAAGRKFVIHRMYLPRPMSYTEEEVLTLRVDDNAAPREVGERLAASYVNFYTCNGGIILPQFDDVEHNAMAIELMQRIYPDRVVVPVYSREILLGGGNIHCITQQVPMIPKKASQIAGALAAPSSQRGHRSSSAWARRAASTAVAVLFFIHPASSFETRGSNADRPSLTASPSFGIQGSSWHLPHRFPSGIKRTGRPGRFETSPHRGWMGDLWSEIIEFSTLGPGERRLLAERRRLEENETEQPADAEIPFGFGEAKRRFDASSGSSSIDDDIVVDGEDLSEAAFRAAVKAQQSDNASSTDTGNNYDDFDGYALRSLLVSRWGVPLDVDFRRDPTSLSRVYCTILPVSYGQRRCRHISELDYLMHLQGVVEVLRQYGNLEEFVTFVQSTNKVPRAGTDSVQYRLRLDDGQLEKIL